MRYSIDEIFKGQNSINGSNQPINEGNYLDYLKKYIEIVNPDFVAIINTKSQNPIMFEKNFNLKFSKGSLGKLQDIIDYGNEFLSDQPSRILQLDCEMMKFVTEYPKLITPQKNLYTVKYLTQLIPNVSVKLRRDVCLLSKDENEMPHFILASWFDVTEINGTKDELLVNVKDFSDDRQINEPHRLKLKEKLNTIITPKIKLTKREKQILQLISEGNTSLQIANYLNISKATVDKHRQNIIKKNNVNSTSAILSSL